MSTALLIFPLANIALNINNLSCGILLARDSIRKKIGRFQRILISTPLLVLLAKIVA
jgi:hypothetical protein